jgi:hypothetical protein
VPPPPWRKIALATVVALAVAGGIAALVAPEIEEGKDERATAERRRDEAFEAAKRRQLARESKPHSGRSARPAGDLSAAAELRARRRLVRDLEREITRDARARARAGRLDGPVLGTRCEINPPSQRPLERDLSVRRMDYECLAITRRDIAVTPSTPRSTTGDSGSRGRGSADRRAKEPRGSSADPPPEGSLMCPLL